MTKPPACPLDYLKPATTDKTAAGLPAAVESEASSPMMSMPGAAAAAAAAAARDAACCVLVYHSTNDRRMFTQHCSACIAHTGDVKLETRLRRGVQVQQTQQNSNYPDRG